MIVIKGQSCLNEGRDRVYRSSDNLSVFYKRDPFSTLDNYWFAIRQCTPSLQYSILFEGSKFKDVEDLKGPFLKHSLLSGNII